MEWQLLYGLDNEPSFEKISEYIGSALWEKLNSHLQETYNAAPKRAHSKCGGAPGWNVKYKKGGKSLCTLYPREGYFIALVVIGNKETLETELALPELTEAVRELYAAVPFVCGGKWLMIHVTNESILSDVMRLIEVRFRVK